VATRKIVGRGRGCSRCCLGGEVGGDSRSGARRRGPMRDAAARRPCGVAGGEDLDVRVHQARWASFGDGLEVESESKRETSLGVVYL